MALTVCLKCYMEHLDHCDKCGATPIEQAIYNNQKVAQMKRDIDIYRAGQLNGIDLFYNNLMKCLRRIF